VRGPENGQEGLSNQTRRGGVRMYIGAGTILLIVLIVLLIAFVF
jgi:hypothetical protein